nr:MAG TPA: hypothetical protein [Caudoviricetes sp.]
MGLGGEGMQPVLPRLWRGRSRKWCVGELGGRH